MQPDKFGATIAGDLPHSVAAFADDAARIKGRHGSTGCFRSISSGAPASQRISRYP